MPIHCGVTGAAISFSPNRSSADTLPLGPGAARACRITSSSSAGGGGGSICDGSSVPGGCGAGAGAEGGARRTEGGRGIASAPPGGSRSPHRWRPCNSLRATRGLPPFDVGTLHVFAHEALLAEHQHTHERILG